jgi:hypothetical protein
MFKTQTFKRDEEGKFTLTKKQFKKMIPLEAPVHVGMNVFPHLYIQFVEIEGENVKILWDFSKIENLPKVKSPSSYSWDYEFVVSANILSRKKSDVRFIEYQKNEIVLAIQV